jgi:hypothetical protein
MVTHTVTVDADGAQPIALAHRLDGVLHRAPPVPGPFGNAPPDGCPGPPWMQCSARAERMRGPSDHERGTHAVVTAPAARPSSQLSGRSAHRA